MPARPRLLTLVKQRRMKVHVEVFSLGFGPRLAGMVLGGTDYRLSLVPMGGYVKVAGEAPEEGAGSPDELLSRGVGQRALYCSGGVIMNLLFGLAVFPIVFAVGVPMREPTIGSVVPGGPAWQAGLREGDVIVSFNGQPVGGIDDLHRLLTQQQVGIRSTIDVIRGTERLPMDVVPAPSPRRA